MKKFLLLALSFVLVLSGCSTSEESTVTQETRGEIRIRGGYNDNFGNDTAQLQYMRDYTGTPVEWIPGPLENPLDKLMLELGSQEEYNLVSASYSEIGPVLEKNLAIDLRPYAQYAPNVVAGIKEEDWATCTDPETGAVYCIPSIQGTSHVINTTIFRKDILEEEGIAVPTTTDELLTATCQLADAGYKRPWAVNWESAAYDYGVRQAFGVGWDYNYNEEGELVYYGNDQRYYDYLDWSAAMYECGGYGLDYETITQEARNASFINGESVFMTAPWWEANAQAEGLATQGIEYKDAVAPLDLTGPGGNKMYEQEGAGGFGYMFIPVYTEKYAVETAEFVNKLFEEEYIVQTRFGVEGVSFDYNEDGVPVKYAGTTPAYPEGYTCVNDNCGHEYWVLGNPNAVLQEEYDAENQERIDMVAQGGGNANDYATVEADKFLEYGNQDPTGAMVLAPLWNKAEICSNSATIEFTDLYVVGKKTKDDVAALETKLDSCGIKEADQEVNDWAKSYNENK